MKKKYLLSILLFNTLSYYTVINADQKLKLHSKDNLDDLLRSIKKEQKEDVKPAEPAVSNNKTSSNIRLAIDRGVIAKNVESSSPVEIANSFKGNIEKLYCYTEISNVEPPEKIFHAWYYKDKLITTIELTLKRSRSYTWSYFNIPSGYTGNWEVHVLSEEGKVIANIPFEIE
ncbi:MAG: DUF2914 domain-containing protein [Candidatus Firestonebacteria bacterium]|nr:DUF2914 domain-containing protein [Candidatus Firestonebacteria bacterium]